MSAREQWQRTYRCARLAGFELVCRVAVERMPYGRHALRIADARLPVATVALLFASRAMKWLRQAGRA